MTAWLRSRLGGQYSDHYWLNYLPQMRGQDQKPGGGCCRVGAVGAEVGLKRSERSAGRKTTKTDNNRRENNMKTEYTGALKIETTIMRVMEPKTKIICNTPEQVAEYCADMRDASQEMFVVVCLNCRNRIIDRVMVSLGIQDSTLVHPREVFRAAILKSAAAIVLVHNHPSGDPTPSAEDIKLTRQMVQTGNIIGIPVQDHVIIGRPDDDKIQSWTSLRELALVEFTP